MDYILINNKKKIFDNKIDKNEFIFINTNDIVLNQKNNIQILILEYDKFIKQILTSYINDDDIHNQFKLDFYRTQVFVNGFELESHTHFTLFTLSAHNFESIILYFSFKETRWSWHTTLACHICFYC